MTGKIPNTSHTILGANETCNDSSYLANLFASINIYNKPCIHHYRIPHPESSLPARANQPSHYLSLSSHCDPLTPSQQQARSKCVSDIKDLHTSTTHPQICHPRCNKFSCCASPKGPSDLDKLILPTIHLSPAFRSPSVSSNSLIPNSLAPTHLPHRIKTPLLQAALVNSRSVRNKIPLIISLMTDLSLDVLFIT